MNDSISRFYGALGNAKTTCLLIIALIFVLGAEIYSLDLYFEEPRRIIPAMRMLEGGSWLVPEIFGEPYIQKPPAFNWYLALTSLPFSTINRINARVGVVGLWACLGLSIYWFSISFFKNRLARVVSTLGIMFSVVILIEKSTLAEPDLFFTLVIFLALGSWFYLTKKRRPMLGSLLAHFFITIGILTKGPVVFLFVYIPLGFVLIFHEQFRRWKELVSGFFVMFVTSSFWLLRTLNTVSLDVLYQSFSNQMVGSGGQFEILKYGIEWLVYPLEVILSLFPFSLLLFYGMNQSFFEKMKREIRQSAGMSLVMGGIIPLLILWFYPRNNIRYLLPAFPWVGLLIGRIVVDLSERQHLRGAFNRILKISVGIFLIAGLVFYLDYDGPTTLATPFLWGSFAVFCAWLLVWCFHSVNQNSVRSKIVFLLGLMLALKAVWLIVYLPLEKPERFVMERTVKESIKDLPHPETGENRTVYFMDVDPLEVAYYFHKHGVRVRKIAREVRYGLKTFEESLEQIPRKKNHYLLTHRRGIGRGWEQVQMLKLPEDRLWIYQSTSLKGPES